MVISLSAKGLTHGEIAAHLAEVYGAEVSKQTITTITDRVMEGWRNGRARPLDPVYAVIFIDAINVKIREGQVANRPVYLALGVTVDGERDVLGLWAGEHGDGEGAKYWLRVLTEIKNRGVRDVCMLVCDGLKGLPDAVSNVWEKTIVQTCIVHLLRNSFKYASKRDWAHRQRPQARLHCSVRVRGAGPVRRVLRQVGEALPGYYPALGERVGGIRAVPAVRPGNKDRHLHDKCDRVDQRPAAARGERPRPLPDRAGGVSPEVPVPGDHEHGPDREGPQAMDQPVEGRPERLRHHLRRPPERGTQVTTEEEVTPET